MVERFSRRYIQEIVTTELQIASVAHFQRKIQLSEFSAYADGSRSQSVRGGDVLLSSHLRGFEFSNFAGVFLYVNT